MVHLVPAGSGAGTYLDWGVVHVSATNALIIVLMLVVFAAALLLPFPGAAAARTHDTSAGARTGPPTTAPDAAPPSAPGSPDDGTGARR